MRNNDLIEHIKENLRNYEEPYRLGAWEQFTRYRREKKRYQIFRRISAAAASLFFVFAFSYLWMNALQFTAPETAEDVRPPAPSEQGTAAPETGELLPDHHPLLAGNPDTSGSGEIGDTTDSPVSARIAEIFSERSPETSQPSPAAKISPSAYDLLVSYRKLPGWDHGTNTRISPLYTSRRGVIPDRSQATFSGEETGLRNIEKNTGIGRTSSSQVAAFSARTDPVVSRSDLARNRSTPLTLGVAYSPLLNIHESGSDWNIGGGVSLEWEFSENVSLASGLFLAQSQFQVDQTQGVFTETDRTHSSGDLEIHFLSMEIPFNLQYSLTPHFFLAGGISSATYLKEEYTYSYEYQEMATVQILIDGEYQPVSQLVTRMDSHTMSEPTLSSFHPLAFYNLSLGYQIDPSRDFGRISIEPFVKIPARSISSGKVSYTTGGLQLKVSF